MRTFTSALVSLGFALIMTACRGDDPVERPVEQPISCGGIAGLACPDGLACVDQPNDDCDPNAGGADCIGMCVQADDPPPKTCDLPGDPPRVYVGDTPEKCAVMRFTCAEHTHYFANECGCGCESDNSL